jgi:site-specific recombinase
MAQLNPLHIPAQHSRATAQQNGDATQQLITVVDAVSALRPPTTSDLSLTDEAADVLIARFSTLCETIENNETLRHQLRDRLLQLFAGQKQVSFFADSGILPNSGFFSELWRRVVQRGFPAIKDAASLKDGINSIFHQRDDWLWLAAIPIELKLRFWHALQIDNKDNIDALEIQQTIVDSISQMLDAGDVLAIRIGAMGLEPELIRLVPQIEEHDSPFVALAGEAQQLSAAYRKHLLDGESPAEDERQLMVLVDQCREVIARVRARAVSVGTSLSLTYLLSRLEQSLQRLEMIVQMLMVRHQSETDASEGMLPDDQAFVTHWVEFLQHALRAESERQSVREHISGTIGLLALRVTENASRTGEHYITSTRAEYFEMWRLATGGGFIVAFMSLVKLISSQTNLVPLGYFMAYAMNYAFGFMFIHVLHLTLATKQPAMTASTIAGAIGEIRHRMRRVESDVEKLATLIVDLVRSQIAAILGNILIAIPTAIIINLALSKLIGQPLMGQEKAHKLIHELSPFESLALFHAAIAGVCLFVAGLISGYYDNLAAYERIRERLEHARWLQSLLGEARLARFAIYMDNNLGALAGNFSLGVMLALVGTIGFLTGLPIDVRHVTLSSANFGLALASLDFVVDTATVTTTLLGIGLVGFVNLSVSFSLALWVAMRARGVALSQTPMLIGILLHRFARAPRQFFWPVKKDYPTVVKP